MLPIFLGLVQLHNGTIKLAIVIFIILSIQVLLVSPFIFDFAAHILGWKLGANTTFYQYLKAIKLLGNPG